MKKKTSKQGMKYMHKFKCNIKDKLHCHGSGGAIYGLGFLGALIYYVTTAPGFWEAVIGFLKAIVWPAVLIHGVLTFLAI